MNKSRPSGKRHSTPGQSRNSAPNVGGMDIARKGNANLPKNVRPQSVDYSSICGRGPLTKGHRFTGANRPDTPGLYQAENRESPAGTPDRVGYLVQWSTNARTTRRICKNAENGPYPCMKQRAVMNKLTIMPMFSIFENLAP